MKKQLIKASILAGFMELLPNEQEKFDDIVNKIKLVYESNGCLPIDTTVLEKSSVLLAKSGGDTEKQVYRFKKGKNDISLRFDLTVPFARYVAQYYNDLSFPFRRYQIGKVYRGERNQKGRYREFYQLDVDVIGENELSINNDALVISLACKAFRSIGLKNYEIQISNRKILKGILYGLKIENSEDVMKLLDKYDKIGKFNFEIELEDLIGVDKSKVLSSVIECKGNNRGIIEKLENLDIRNECFLEGLDELNKVNSMLTILGVKESEYRINLKIIRGLDYYTSTVFETIIIGNEDYGSICSGGRYENLAGIYTEKVLPGVGISIGLTRLFFVLKEIGFIENYRIKNKLDYLIIPIGDTLEYCGLVMRSLEKKYGVSIYFENQSLKKIMKYADRLGVENVIFIGEDEAKNNEVKIRNMLTGEEGILKYEDIE